MAPARCTCRRNSQTLARHARRPSSANTTASRRSFPDTDIFVGYSLRAQQLLHAKKFAMDSFHRGRRSAAHVPGTPRFQHHGHESQRQSSPSQWPKHTLGLIIALARNFPDSVRHQDQSRWAQQELWDQPQHLPIKWPGIANRRLRLHRPRTGSPRESLRHARLGRLAQRQRRCLTRRKIVSISQLHEVLPHADFAVVSAPETSETKHLIAAPELARMKSTARLINVARGSLLDQSALLAALQQKRIAGAALDVTDPEPLPAADPLWKAPNLLVTPHTSAISDRLCRAKPLLLLDLLELWFAGRDLFNQVDLHRGY